MPWLLLLKSPWTWVTLAFFGLGSYAAVQHVGWQTSKAELAQFRADVESEAAEAKVRNAQEAARQAQNAQEVLGDLQTRHDALSARYDRLRARPGSSPVPAVPGATVQLVTLTGSPPVPDADARCLAVLETADRELTKYVELWRLEQANAAKQP